eukprot:g8026.t1
MDTVREGTDKVSATRKYVVVAADYRDNEFDDIFMSQSRKEQKERRRRQQQIQNKKAKETRPETPSILKTNTISFLEINKSFQFLRLERWRKPPESFDKGVKLLKKWLVNNSEVLARSFYQYKLKKLALQHFCKYTFDTTLQNVELARILARQQRLKRRQRSIEWEVRCGNDFNLALEKTRKRVRLFLKCWYNYVSDQKINDTDNIKWNQYIRYKRKGLSKEEETKLVESRLSADNFDVYNDSGSMSIVHPYTVRETIVALGMEPWQTQARNAQNSREEKMYKTKFGGYQSTIFTYNQTGLGRDAFYEQ